jgi:hypothetical protein
VRNDAYYDDARNYRLGENGQEAVVAEGHGRSDEQN